MKIIIIDTGCANLSSVKFALDRLGYQAEISRDTVKIEQADKLLLPGVGTAKAAMANLEERGLIDCIQNLRQPVLGICLGMQLMATFSEEGNLPTLGLIEGRTEKIPNQGLPLPHMGWNKVEFLQDSALFHNIPTNSYFYFVHSFAVLPNANTLASCHYGVPFSAVLQRGNFYGVQFHPERSGQVGATLLRNFIEKI